MVSLMTTPSHPFITSYGWKYWRESYSNGYAVQIEIPPGDQMYVAVFRHEDGSARGLSSEDSAKFLEHYSGGKQWEYISGERLPLHHDGISTTDAPASEMHMHFARCIHGEKLNDVREAIMSIPHKVKVRRVSR